MGVTEFEGGSRAKDEFPKVWIPDSVHGYCLGKIVDILSDTVSVQLSKSNEIRHELYENALAAEEDDEKEVDDNCSLMYLNEATLLNNLKLRYEKDKIYTYVANILIAVNPYFEIKDLYSPNTISQYEGKSLGVLPPHVFAIADKAFRDMRALKSSQSIIVSGESGAGKTESTKYILRYLCKSWGCHARPIEQRILDANPVLEAFGNAKTMRNNNSSRFGKFIEIHFNNKFSVVGGFISHYLLEKSRICSQNDGERNYHIFYQLCAGAPADIKEKLLLSSPDKFLYLKKSCTQYFTSKETEKLLNKESKSSDQQQKGSLHDPMLDDVLNFQALDKALNNMGLTNSDRMHIYTVVASVLHLGNVTFEDNPDDCKGGCRLALGSIETLRIIGSLLQVDSEYLKQSLLSRVMQTSKGGTKGTIYMVPLKVHEAQNARDALAKALYSRLFDYIVLCINKSIPFSSSSYYIGVLDIAGFEYFQVNSFEQFCINYCNEKLQQFFNERILKEEQALYEREHLNVQKIDYIDNQDCIELIENKGSGIFDLLNEESKLPKSSHTHFTSMVHSQNNGHFRLDIPRKSKLKYHREIRDNEGFLIRHFAGAVCYETVSFLEKNNDALHASLESVILESENNFVQNLFKSETTQNTRGKLNFNSVSSKFRSQLNELMTKLQNTGTHFVRCIKPNFRMVDHCFEGNQILIQLRCSGMTSVLQLMQQGYPSRAQFSDLYDMYKKYLPPDLARLDHRLFCKSLFRALGLNEKDFCFGVNKVFFRPGKFAEFDQIMKSDPENLASLIQKVKKWLIHSRWRKAIWGSLAVVKLKNKIKFRRENLVIIQKNLRMHFIRQKYRPRYMHIYKMRKLIRRLNTMTEIVDQLKAGKDESMQRITLLSSDMKRSMDTAKTGQISPEKLDKDYTTFVMNVDELLIMLRRRLEQQKIDEEQEQIRKIQAEMEKDRLQKEAEMKKKLEEEDLKRRKMDIELQRKYEEKCRIEEEKETKMQMEAYEAELLLQEEDEKKKRLQEHSDHELALRLAQDMNGIPDEVVTPPRLPRSAYVMQQQEQLASKKYDLSKWKYSEIRDTINTSIDLELLQACREEFHRRLKNYQNWKVKNIQKGESNNTHNRIPDSIMLSAKSVPPMPPKRNSSLNSSATHRYFRIPFVRQNSAQKGWWYAHFHGQWIARQMELHPDKPPIQLVAGKDDMQMCELSLEETGLTRKRGAEILEEEFNAVWEKHGGTNYPNSCKN